MKYKFKYLLFIFILLISLKNVEALSVSSDDLVIDTGKSETISLYANLEETATSVDFTLTFTTYDIVADFFVNPEFKDTTPNLISHNIVFNEAKTGKVLLGTIKISVKDVVKDLVGDVNLTKASAKNGDNTTNLKSQFIGVKVNSKEEVDDTLLLDKDTSLLDKINSKIVNITLIDNTFLYQVDITDKISELDLEPIAKDNNTKIEISTQKINELKDNKIIITAKNGNITNEYIIKVNITKTDITKNIKTAVVDNTVFIPNNSYKKLWIMAIILLGIGLGITLAFNIKKKKKIKKWV